MVVKLAVRGVIVSPMIEARVQRAWRSPGVFAIDYPPENLLDDVRYLGLTEEIWMAWSPAQLALRERLIAAAKDDPRIVGLLCDGSHSAGRGDEWSDLDVSVFVRDDDFDLFSDDWRVWAANFGDILLGYISWVGHPWVVYAAEPVPLRVDFDLHRASTIDAVRDWPSSVTSRDVALWYDDTGEQLANAVDALVGRSLAPDDLSAAFEQQCGDFWYEALYVHSRLQRGEGWIARQAFHYRAMEPLLRLLRLGAGAIERWQASPSAAGLEAALTPERLAQLDRCIPGPGAAELARALHEAARLAYAVCESVADQHHWEWPERLAIRVIRLIDSAAAASRKGDS